MAQVKTLKFDSIPAGTKPIDSLVQDFEACAEGGMAQRSLIIDVRAVLDKADDKVNTLFQVAQSYATACAKWDVQNPAKNFEDSRERNKAKTKALAAPMSYLNREVIRPLGREVKKTKEGYGLAEYQEDMTTEYAKAQKTLAAALKKFSPGKAAHVKHVEKAVRAWQEAAA